MYTLTLLSTLFATSALAIPNPEKHSAVTSAGYGAWPSKPTHTVVITTTVVVSPVPEVQTTSLLATSSSTLPTFILAPNSTQTQSPSSASVSATPTFSAEPEPEELAGVSLPSFLHNPLLQSYPILYSKTNSKMILIHALFRSTSAPTSTGPENVSTTSHHSAPALKHAHNLTERPLQSVQIWVLCVLSTRMFTSLSSLPFSSCLFFVVC